MQCMFEQVRITSTEVSLQHLSKMLWHTTGLTARYTCRRSCAEFVNAYSNLIRIVFSVNYWFKILILAIITLVSILNYFCLQLGVNPAENDLLPLAIVGFPQSFQLRYRFGLAVRDS